MAADWQFRWRTLALVAAFLLAGVSADDFETAGGVRICDNGDIGYNSMEELNAAIQAEVNNISPGDPPRDEPYTFVLCPNRVYDVTSAPFSPMLSNVVISCGMAGIPDGPDGTCNFFGGSESVRMDTNDYHLTLMGLTFTNFQSVAITGDADSSSTVQLIRTNFEVGGAQCLCAYLRSNMSTRILQLNQLSYSKTPKEKSLSTSLWAVVVSEMVRLGFSSRISGVL